MKFVKVVQKRTGRWLVKFKIMGLYIGSLYTPYAEEPSDFSSKKEAEEEAYKVFKDEEFCFTHPNPVMKKFAAKKVKPNPFFSEKEKSVVHFLIKFAALNLIIWSASLFSFNVAVLLLAVAGVFSAGVLFAKLRK